MLDSAGETAASVTRKAEEKALEIVTSAAASAEIAIEEAEAKRQATEDARAVLEAQRANLLVEVRNAKEELIGTEAKLETVRADLRKLLG
jgi:septal ring factor EnvC (AmiA/AmiB activator)